MTRIRLLLVGTSRYFLACPVSRGMPRIVARRIEARIGELLGQVKERQRSDLTVRHGGQLDKHLRSDFRALANLVRRAVVAVVSA